MMKTAFALFCLASCAYGAAPSLDEFQGVHKAWVEREGANCVRVRFPSAEWGTGIKWTSDAGADFSSAKWLSVDVENLSKTRQSRLTMHVSAGVAEGDSGDHATAIFKKNVTARKRWFGLVLGDNAGVKRV